MMNTELRQVGAPIDSTPFAMGKILIVDDLEDARWALSNLIRQAGFAPLVAASGKEALTRIQTESPDLVLLDVCLPDMGGFEVLTWARAHDKGVPVIMLTAYGKTHDAVRAIRAGAYDYLSKPFNHENILLTVGRAIEERASRRQLGQFRERPPRQAGPLLDSMGNSATVQRIQMEVEQVAPTNFSVLVTGETGTGKELVAQAIHAQSLRAARPIIVVDCGAIPEPLIESELFGHEKGAFTGAHQAKAGAFELAEGGTIFLDEIGNLPLAMQGKLLRVLETRRVHRIGSMNERDVDFRVVAATNEDLRATIEQQMFRRDLYHRLAEFTICLPPLRERKEDLRFLAHRFLVEANKELSKEVGGLSIAAWGIIEQYDWPGNVRELRNQLRRAVLLSDEPEGMIKPECLRMLGGVGSSLKSIESIHQPKTHCPLKDGPGACPVLVAATFLSPEKNVSLKELVGGVTAQVERAILLQALKLTEGNKAQCARLLHIDYKTIHSKLKAYEISSNRLSGTLAKLQDVES